MSHIFSLSRWHAGLDHTMPVHKFCAHTYNLFGDSTPQIHSLYFYWLQFVMKYVKNCCSCHEIWCRHSLSPDDVSSKCWWIHCLYRRRQQVEICARITLSSFMFSFCFVFFMLWQQCAYGLVRVRKENIFCLIIPVLIATNAPSTSWKWKVIDT